MEPKDTLMEQLSQTREEKNKETLNYLNDLAQKHQVQLLVAHIGGIVMNGGFTLLIATFPTN